MGKDGQMQLSKIQWTDVTWNCIRGCSLVSEGCRNCYAMRQAHRFSGTGHPYEGLTHMVNGHPVWTGKVVCDESKLEEPLHWKKPRMVFVNSMADLFHEDVPLGFIDQVFSVMWRCSPHTFQVLTKRPERMCAYMQQSKHRWNGVTPLSNVWLGVSVEDQKTADERIPLLLQTPAAVRWVSYEPALAAIDFIENGASWTLCGLSWIVVGGESGPNARPFNLEWARSVLAQCKAAGVPCFVKQLGRFPYDVHETNPPKWKYNAGTYLALTNHKGGDMSEWPEDLRVREYPMNSSLC